MELLLILSGTINVYTPMIWKNWKKTITGEMKFKYICINHSGDRVNGVVVAMTKSNAEKQLNNMHRSIVILKEIKS